MYLCTIRCIICVKIILIFSRCIVYVIINRCYESSNRLFIYYSVGIFRVRFSAIVRFNVITICVKVLLLFRKLMYFPCWIRIVYRFIYYSVDCWLFFSNCSFQRNYIYFNDRMIHVLFDIYPYSLEDGWCISYLYNDNECCANCTIISNCLF